MSRPNKKDQKTGTLQTDQTTTLSDAERNIATIGRSSITQGDFDDAPSKPLLAAQCVTAGAIIYMDQRVRDSDGNLGAEDLTIIRGTLVEAGSFMRATCEQLKLQNEVVAKTDGVSAEVKRVFEKIRNQPAITNSVKTAEMLELMFKGWTKSIK
jgi:hypothetical protein